MGENHFSPHSSGAVARPPWIRRAAFPVVTALFFATQAGIAAAVARGWVWLALPLALLSSHFMHGLLIGFHEAAHGLLRKNRFLNEVDGVLIGTLSLVSFSAFRAVHQSHHVRLATVRDEEMWPLVLPTAPRWARVLWAAGELVAGLVFTPILFLRSFLRCGSPIRSRKVRRRIWLEYLLMACFWPSLLLAVAHWSLWPYFVWMYLVPAWIAASLQSLRKYIEHIGLTGTSVKGLTRSIVAEGWLGRAVAVTLLHEPFHGVHHRRAGLGHAMLPDFADELCPSAPGDVPPYRSYWHAFLDLAGHLDNPRVGPQWVGAARQ